MAEWNFPGVSKGSLRALATEIRLQISGGLISDDNTYPVRLIENEIKHQHGLAQYEEDKLNEAMGIQPNSSRQVIYSCLKLKDSNDFNCKCTKTGGKFKKVELPKMLEWQGQSYLKYVGNTDMDMAFVKAGSIGDLNSIQEFIKKPVYFQIGTSLYVSLPADYALMCEITVVGIPDDPSSGDGLCFDVWSTEWPVAEYMKAIVKARVIQTLAPQLVSTNLTRDVRNNAQDANQFLTIQTP